MRLAPALLFAAACSQGQAGGSAASAVATPSEVAASASSPALTQTGQGAPGLPVAKPKGDPALACAEGSGLELLVTPEVPEAGKPLRVIVAAPTDPRSALTLSRGGKVVARAEPKGAAPVFYAVTETRAEAGSYEIKVDGEGGKAACLKLEVAAEAPPAKHQPPWSVRAAWSRRAEDLYSAWVLHLFDAKPGEDLTFSALHEAIRDAKRNFLADHLAPGEDTGERAPLLDPDCADLPFFLRAYFARKLHLPFGYSACTRGRGGVAPRCLRFYTHQALKRGKHSDPMRAFGEFLRTSVADTVHSGSGRSAASGDNTDFYPVALQAKNLRPGSIYADPYGHVLVLLGQSPQREDEGGALFAVDGQPDGTITRKRFWRGQFLFHPDTTLGSPGFKRFRPVVVKARGVVKQLANAEVAEHADYGDFSLEQYDLDVESFYDRMDALLNPLPRDPERALLDAILALEEQVRGRVRSVQNGTDFVAKHPAVIDMPEGPKIFETEGPWEDYSSPSRDLRLLIAIDVVSGFPGKVRRQPARFRLPAGKGAEVVAKELEARLQKELGARTFEYPRTDGSKQKLTLLDVTARAQAIEIGWNPNDCAELRWGAPKASDEGKTCKRRAPADQRAAMEKVRSWFHERKRPPR